LDSKSLTDKNNTKIVEAMYRSMPYNVCCCRSSSRKSFLSNAKIVLVNVANDY
jgi:hypothetical protein